MHCYIRTFWTFRGGILRSVRSNSLLFQVRSRVSFLIPLHVYDPFLSLRLVQRLRKYDVHTRMPMRAAQGDLPSRPAVGTQLCTVPVRRSHNVSTQQVDTRHPAKWQLLVHVPNRNCSILHKLTPLLRRW